MTIAAAYAGRLVPCRLVERGEGETPRRCLEWKYGAVSFAAHVIVQGQGDAADKMKGELERVGYVNVTVQGEVDDDE